MGTVVDKAKSSFSDSVVAQRIVDEQVGIDATIAALRDISVADKEQQIEMQTLIAYLSLFSTSTVFIAEAEKLTGLIDESDVEQLSVQTQAILRLADNAGMDESKSIIVAQAVQNIVDGLCSAENSFGLQRKFDDVRKLSHNFYRWKMSLACYSLIHDEPSHELARHLALVPVVIDPNRPCITIQEGGVNILVARWLTCELQQKGIDMSTLLKSVTNKHERRYNEALSEYGVPFHSP